MKLACQTSKIKQLANSQSLAADFSSKAFVLNHMQKSQLQNYTETLSLTIQLVRHRVILQVPSAVPFILEIFEKHSVFMSMYYQPLSNCWTLMGKVGSIFKSGHFLTQVANFVLFCLSSVYFRKRLMKILKRRVIF